MIQNHTYFLIPQKMCHKYMLFKMSFAINRMSDESKAKISSLVAGTVQNNKTLDIRRERDDSGQIASRGFKKANCEKLKYTKEIVGIF